MSDPQRSEKGPLPRGGQCRNYRGKPKVVYASEAEALDVVKRLQGILLSASKRRPYQAYHCEHGHDGWHVGRTPKADSTSREPR